MTNQKFKFVLFISLLISSIILITFSYAYTTKSFTINPIIVELLSAVASGYYVSCMVELLK
jgi:hypothetical protein